MCLLYAICVKSIAVAGTATGGAIVTECVAVSAEPFDETAEMVRLNAPGEPAGALPCESVTGTFTTRVLPSELGTSCNAGSSAVQTGPDVNAPLAGVNTSWNVPEPPCGICSQVYAS